MSNPILLMIGDHPRNLHLMNTIIENFGSKNEIQLILQKRKNLIPTSNQEFSDEFKNLFNLHFKKREKSEISFFKKKKIPKNINILNVNLETLNSFETIQFVKNKNFKLCFSFGIGVVRKQLLEVLPELSINIHTGITPRYKGDAGNFWPFYFFEPNWAGVTFHKLSEKVDDGAILHQLTPELKYNDGIHDVSCKAVIKASNDVLKIIDYFNIKKELKFIKSKDEGRYFRSRDFLPIHLKSIYDYYDDKIVNLYLDKKISPLNVRLIDFFNTKK